jgi:hypothetical protein
MKGPFRRIRTDRPPADPAFEDQPPAPDAPAPADVQVEVLPAGLAPEDVAPRLSFRNRGRLRRRLRYLRRVRELGYRDLGGLAFDLHRFGRRNDELVLGKLQALDAVDHELRALERVLDDRRDVIELREPGISACPRCGALHGSDARFCPSCGTEFRGPLVLGELGGGPLPPAPAVTPMPAPSPYSGAQPRPDERPTPVPPPPAGPSPPPSEPPTAVLPVAPPGTEPGP